MIWLGFRSCHTRLSHTRLTLPISGSPWKYFRDNNLMTPSSVSLARCRANLPLRDAECDPKS
jgi:hypothetical protein